jgi:hypothetical protein
VANVNGPILRCPDLDGALRSLAAIFAATPKRIAGALPEAAAAVAADPIAEEERAIVPVLIATLGQAPAVPGAIHFFHGTRAFDPGAFTRQGLLPLPAALDEIWARLTALVPEIPPARFAALREGLEDGRIKALTYKDRIDGHDDGPHGLLVRDILVHPEAYSSSQFACIPEIVEDICIAAHAELGIDLEARFEQAATSCIVEFTAPPHEHETAIHAACWYADAALRGQPTAADDLFFNFGGDGVAIPPEGIVAVEILS